MKIHLCTMDFGFCVSPAADQLKGDELQCDFALLWTALVLITFKKK